MADKLITPEDQEFLASTGLEPNNLAPLVADAPPLSAATLGRIRAMARVKVGLTESTVAPPASRRPASRRPRWWMAAAASLLLLGGALAVANPDAAMAAVQRLVRLVPGIGLTATDDGTLVMAVPVSVESGGERLTVTGLISDGRKTELRFVVDGLPLSKGNPGEPLPPFEPALRLPDGRVLAHQGASSGAGPHDVSGIIWFEALPPGTTDLTLLLPSVHGMTQPFEVAIAVVDAGSAGLAKAETGGWSQERLGLRIGVPHWIVRDDRIVLDLEASLPAGQSVAEIGEVIGDRRIEPVLTDDQGRVYPLISGESKLRFSSGDALSATFQGPIAPDAGRLRLSIPVLRVTETAEATLRIPLSQLPVDEPLELGEELKIGSRRFTVDAVTRLDEDTFHFKLDLGPEQDGALLQELRISPYRVHLTGGGWGSAAHMSPENWQIETIEYTPDSVPGRNLEVVFQRPVVRLEGEWEVVLPGAR